jgi:hypothetical protein
VLVSPIESICLVAGVGYAVYLQTQVKERVGRRRFLVPIIYAIVGIGLGGISPPDGLSEYLLFAGSLLFSIAVGYCRAQLTRIWAAPDGRVYSQGTPTTIALYLGMIAFKVVLGILARIWGLSHNGGFGEILAMTAVMMAFQVEFVWRRARPLVGTVPPVEAGADSALSPAGRPTVGPATDAVIG